MLTPPSSPYRAHSCGTSFDLESYLRRVFTSVGYVPSDGSAVGSPGPQHGTARCGGGTYRFAVEYFADQVLSKLDDGKPETDELKTKAALAKFREAEELCKQTNLRFDRYFYGHRPENQDVTRVLLRAREKIGRLLSSLDWRTVVSEFTFTRGGSVKLPRARGTPIHKYSTTVETTEQAFSILRSVFPTIPIWGPCGQEPATVIVPGNKLTCVPKNFKTHRMIAGEPTGNMYLQKGLHSALRDVLRSVGIDLSSQKQNQEWAHFGSVTGLVATVDMSMASDTVSYSLVEWLLSLCPEVFALLDSLRSATGEFAGETVTYRKFSSMGNACTFELETLIFWALATSVCDVLGSDSRFVSVYGDDVVIPNRCVPLFFDVLKECGFVPNPDKSHWDREGEVYTTRFRESCGMHYLNGENVTPVYVKKVPEGQLDHFKLVNNLTRWLRRMEALSDAPCLRKAWDVVSELRRELAPPSWQQPRIPDGFGDGAFIGTFDECTPKTVKAKHRPWVEGYAVEVLTERFDQAIGIDLVSGTPLVRYKAKKGRKTGLVSIRLKGKALKDAKKQVSGVTLKGFCLASLERLERQGPAWPEYTRRFSPRIVALWAGERDLPTEGAGIVISSSRQVSTTTLTIDRETNW